MAKPTIYGFDDAGCKWSVYHKEEIDGFIFPIRLPVYGLPSQGSSIFLFGKGMEPTLPNSSLSNQIIIKNLDLGATYYYKLFTDTHTTASKSNKDGTLTVGSDGISYLDISQGSFSYGDVRGFSIVGYKDNLVCTELWASFDIN